MSEDKKVDGDVWPCWPFVCGARGAVLSWTGGVRYVGMRYQEPMLKQSAPLDSCNHSRTVHPCFVAITRLLIRFCIFRWDLPYRVWRQSHGFVWFLFGAAPAPFCVVPLFFCWRKRKSGREIAGRRCCRVFSLCFGLTMMCLVMKPKCFIILYTFLPLLSLSGPSLRARSATTEEKRKDKRKEQRQSKR